MTGAEISDGVLWLEAISGTERSFAVLYDRHRERVFRSAYRKLGAVADAEDVVAMVFLEAWRLRRKVRIVDGSVLPWLLAVTTNTSLNFTRAQRRYRRMLDTLPPSLDEADHAASVEQLVDGEKRTESLRRALRKLSSGDRAVVDMCLIEELPQSVVARALDIPEGTVKSRLHRARRQLARELESDGVLEKDLVDVQEPNR
ncbi:RNA polymerase sigma factor [Pseudoclavibacter sp. AY1H1]|uniref:RNA polymerase sigma factor n=1 Tax=Pseudoclavibacter sp. AY1H1 TaxID=2080584 RepID=UPI0015E39C8D|nr:RNA polymerase sigma factor [Pseudoclavibacter sp. AY1H1]